MSDRAIKILLVEDNPGDVVIIREMIREIDDRIELIHVARLDEGLKNLIEDSFDVILLDLHLPDSQGISTFRFMNQKAPHLPIIILTGLNDEEFAIKAVGDGAQDYLIKGQIDNQLLSRSIKYAIERKRIEEALRRSEERYRIMVENAQSGVFFLSSTDKLSYINKQMAEILGYNLQEMLNQKISNFVHEEGELSFKRHLKGDDKGLGQIYEVRFKHKNGSSIWALTSIKPIFKSDGKYLGAVGIINDISARKGVEKSLMDAMIEKDHNFMLIMGNMIEAMKPLIQQEFLEEYEGKFT